VDAYDFEEINYDVIGLDDSTSEVLIIWAHGWGHNSKSFASLAESLSGIATSYLLDLPGFGKSKEPGDTWGTEEYAEVFSEFVEAKANGRKVVWVGHSFGGSVGVQLAGSYPGLLSGLGLVAAAGLRSQRSLFRKTYIWSRIKVFKLAKRVATLFGIKHDKLYEVFGSTDYKQAGSMRKIMVKTINEDLSSVAEKIDCATAIIYGENDTATPPEFGIKYSELIKDSKLSILSDQDHYTLIGDGRHLVVKRLKELVKSI